MNEVSLKLRYHFDAAHKLEAYKGPCAQLHGHRWNVTVYAKGNIDSNGMLIDFTLIKKEIDKLDHKFLNEILSFNPTAENIASYLLKQFETLYPNIKFKIRLYESPNASIEVKSYLFDI